VDRLQQRREQLRLNGQQQADQGGSRSSVVTMGVVAAMAQLRRIRA
jgi:hypothetical protein